MINQNNRYPDKESYPRTLITYQEYLNTITNSKDAAVGNYIIGTPTKSWFGTHVSYRMAIHLTNLRRLLSVKPLVMNRWFIGETTCYEPLMVMKFRSKEIRHRPVLLWSESCS